MWVKGIVTCHLIFILDSALSNGDNDGGQPALGLMQVCDDGKTGIEIDLSGEKDWKCQENFPWTANQWYIENKRCYEQERAYHVCIDTDINSLYKASIPHSGPHRKVWAQYGEYKYLPPGRYVHNLEHDAVVFMYHPCAPSVMIDELRRTATSCLTRHIITAFANLTEQFPFAVVTYGCVFQMSTVDPLAIKSWVRGRFGKSPEPDEYGNGEYNYGLIIPAPKRISYDYDEDTPFCPDNSTILRSISTKVAVTPTDISYSDADYFDSGNIPYHTDEVSETETADMLFNEPKEIPQPGNIPYHTSEVSKTATVDMLLTEPKEIPQSPGNIPYHTNEVSETGTVDMLLTEPKEIPQSPGNIPYHTSEVSKTATVDMLLTEPKEIPQSPGNIPYHTNEVSETGTADMLFTEPNKISQPPFDLPQEDSVPFKIISTINSFMKTPTVSNSPQVVISQKISPAPISNTFNPLAMSATPEHDTVNKVVSTTLRGQITDDSQQSFSLHSNSETTSSIKSKSVSSIPTKTDVGQDVTDRTSFFFIGALAVLLYIVGIAFGCFLHWCYKRNRSRNFRDSKVWRDDDGQGSFNIAAIVRKRPQLPRRGGTYDKYQMLQDDFSDEDSVA